MPTVRALPSLARAAAAVVAIAASAGALAAQQQRTLYGWTGRVDRELLLVMKGGNVTTRTGFGLGDRGNFRVGTDLPRTDGSIDVRVSRGRGSVDVVQQPSARNDYTAVVRVRDDADGAGDYQITTYWRPVSGSYGDNGGYGNTGGSGNNGGYGRGDNDGRWDDRRDRRDDRRDRRDDRRDRRDDRRDQQGRSGDRNDGRGGWSSGGWGNNNSGSGTLRWSGRVDNVTEIRIRGRQASTHTVSGSGTSNVRTSVSGSGLSDRSATVRVRTFDGRGNVRVVEQPSSRNGYTAVLRIEDREGGAGYYDFEASWY